MANNRDKSFDPVNVNNNQSNMSGFFHSSRKQLNDVALAKELVQAVMDADARPYTGKVQTLLAQIEKLPPHICIVTSKVKNMEEKCGRIWKRPVSALEFAAWAGDIYLLELLLTKVPVEHKKQALAQLEGVKENGLEHGEMMAPIKVSMQSYKTCENSFGRLYAWTDRERKYAEEFVRQRQHGWYCRRSDFELQAVGHACSVKGGGPHDAFWAMGQLCQLSAAMLNKNVQVLQNEIAGNVKSLAQQ